jgi:nucleotide-binding universal stress UspA family protein
LLQEASAVFKDILLPLVSYPKVAPGEVIRSAAGLAQHLGATLTAIVLEIEVGPGLYFEGAEIGTFLDQENAKSRTNAQQLVQTFRSIAEAADISYECRVEKSVYVDAGARVIEEARVKDLCVVPLHEDNDGDRDLVERLVFAGGAPALIAPSGARKSERTTFDRVAIAWDSSRPAARAVADALPLLQRAAKVRVFSIENEKKFETFRTGVDLARHLSRHGIDVEIDAIEKGRDQTIGQAFKSYVSKHKIDLLVMGAYGHSRMREFVLGGATLSVLTDPPCWTLLSHG